MDNRNFDVVNLGSSQSYFAFDYTDMDISGRNWATPPQSFEYDYKILQTFHRYIKENTYVIIPVSTFSFFLFRFPETKHYIKYYKILPPDIIHNYSNKIKYLYIDYPILSAKSNLKRLIKDIPVDNRLEIQTNPMEEQEMKIDAEQWIDRWQNSFFLKGLDDIFLSIENEKNISQNIILMNKIINFCLEKNYRPVIALLPPSKELISLFPQSFIDKYILENIKRANTQEIPVLNYWNDGRFLNPNYFLNAFFFNLNGRKEFTKTMINDIKRI